MGKPLEVWGQPQGQISIVTAHWEHALWETAPGKPCLFVVLECCCFGFWERAGARQCCGCEARQRAEGWLPPEAASGGVWSEALRCCRLQEVSLGGFSAPCQLLAAWEGQEGGGPGPSSHGRRMRRWLVALPMHPAALGVLTPQHPALPRVPGLLPPRGGRGSPANPSDPAALGVLLLPVLHEDPWEKRGQHVTASLQPPPHSPLREHPEGAEQGNVTSSTPNQGKCLRRQTKER